MLCCRGNREIQETSIRGAAGLKSYREVLSCKGLCEPRVKMCVFFMCICAGCSVLLRASHVTECEHNFNPFIFLILKILPRKEKAVKEK